MIAIVLLTMCCSSCGVSFIESPVPLELSIDGQGFEERTDVDRDGLSDLIESQLAELYFPMLSLDPDDRCPLHGVVYRVTPHPRNPRLVAIRYTILYERDCGFDDHVGDNEAFGMLIDPSRVAPDGILALRAIAHQNTWCETITTCGKLPGCTPCVEASKRGVPGYPVLFSSRGKHGNYLHPDACSGGGFCNLGGRCTLRSVADDPPMVNAGEPKHPLVRDLTESGFITPAEGWTVPELRHFDPWRPKGFGSAGRVDEDLRDPAFLIDPSGCRG